MRHAPIAPPRGALVACWRMASKKEPQKPVKIGFSRLETMLRRAHAQGSDFKLISPSPVEGRAVIEIARPDSNTRTRYAFPAEDIERVAELLASINVGVADLRRRS
jgi:hypothetical protein